MHYHFKNKLEILLAVGQRLSALITKRTEMLGHDLDAFVRAHLGFGEGADSSAVAAWVAVGAEAVFQPDVRVLYEELLEQRQAVLMSLLETEFPAWTLHERRGRAELLIALIEGYFQLSAAAPATFEPGPPGPDDLEPGAIQDPAEDVLPSNLRRLSRGELDRVMGALLHTTFPYASTMLPEDDQEREGLFLHWAFDNRYTHQPTERVLVQAYEGLAREAASQLVADAERLAMVLLCSPSGADDSHFTLGVGRPFSPWAKAFGSIVCSMSGTPRGMSLRW